MNQNNFLLEAEATFYESLSKISDHANQLSEGSIDVSFSDSLPYSQELRSNFYAFLCSHIKSLTTLKEVFELICQQHGVAYKE